MSMGTILYSSVSVKQENCAAIAAPSSILRIYSYRLTVENIIPKCTVSIWLLFENPPFAEGCPLQPYQNTVHSGCREIFYFLVRYKHKEIKISRAN